MTARMGNKGVVGTLVVGTPNQHLRAKLRSADFHPGQGLLVAWQYPA